MNEGRERLNSHTQGILIKLLTLSLLLTAGVTAQAAPRVKVLKLAVSNPTDEAHPHEDVVVSVAELKRVAPDFSAVECVVTTSDASTLDEDAHTLQAAELPSQADDTDGDGKYDEIAFQIDLKPRQTRVVTIAYGDAATMQRLRSDYPTRTHAKFTLKFDGLGWESEESAWRIYFDRRNAIDLWGKRRPGLYLELFGSPEYAYAEESPPGRDIYRIGDAIGLGSVGALVNGKVEKVSDVAERSWRIVSEGPVRVVVELKYKGWKVGGREVNLTSRITQWAGERGFEHLVRAEGAEGLTLVAGMVRQAGLQEKISEPTADEPALWRAAWGHQVVAPGPTATAMLTDENLGTAVIAPGRESKAAPDDSLNFLVEPRVSGGVARWYVIAAWDQEGSDRMRVSAGVAAEKYRDGSVVVPPNAVTTFDGFTRLVGETARRITRPARVELLSKASSPQSAPPATLSPARSKTFADRKSTRLNSSH